MPEPRRVILLGSTGSIGTQTLEVIDHLNSLHAQGLWPARFRVVGLSAHSNASLLAAQARRFAVRDLALATPPPSDADFAEHVLRRGPDAPERLVRQVDADLVVAAMSGVAGLPSTLAAVELGRDLALANKEALVAAGELIVPAARRTGSRLLPVDSEHSAVWQLLAPLLLPSPASPTPPAAPRVQVPLPLSTPFAPPVSLEPLVARVMLTASGGPFRTWTKDQLQHATPAQALNHPTWSMGRKITIDSASLMNKALELIEAHWLFGLPPDRLDAIIHPQSIVHAMIEHADGALLAQLAAPDMRLPIQHALTFPVRAPASARRLDLASLSRLHFEPVDPERFPALDLARAAMARGTGPGAGATLNAANEAAVEAFIAGRVPFPRIASLVAEALDSLPAAPIHSLSDVLEADARARAFVASRLEA
ncbi:MAG: 1-deoxy-D-xylulose-5-phosphate reductoisomerase [Phycisphaerae bacterium]|nr:1-deoxy-D-xylulose-5-phosphate reductoisomerase [Phycisphaerae bacterium]